MCGGGGCVHYAVSLYCAAGGAAAGCKEEIEPDFVPLICLLVGILTLVLLHLVAFLISTSDRYVTKTLKEKTVKKWMSLHQGTASMHAAAVSCDRIHTHTHTTTPVSADISNADVNFITPLPLLIMIRLRRLRRMPSMRLECCWGGRRCVTVSSLTTQARRRNTSRIPWPSQRQALSPRHCEPHQPSQAIAGVSHLALPCLV